MYPIYEHLYKLVKVYSLDAWLDKSMFEAGVEGGAYSHISNPTDDGVALEVLQAGGAANTHAAGSTCRQLGTRVRHTVSLLLIQE